MEIFRPTPYDSQFIFSGNTFKAITSVNFVSGSSTSILLQTRSKTVHLLHRQMYTLNTLLKIGIQITDSESGGGAVQTFPPSNTNREYPTTSTAIFTVANGTTEGPTPVVLENFTLIPSVRSDLIAPEIILRPNSNYMLKLNTTGAGTGTCIFYYVWYESQN